MGRPSEKANCFELGEILAVSKNAMIYFGDSEDTDLFKIHYEIASDDTRINFAHADVKCAEEVDAKIDGESGLVLFKNEYDQIINYNGTTDQEVI